MCRLQEVTWGSVFARPAEN